MAMIPDINIRLAQPGTHPRVYVPINTDIHTQINMHIPVLAYQHICVHTHTHTQCVSVSQAPVHTPIPSHMHIYTEEERCTVRSISSWDKILCFSYCIVIISHVGKSLIMYE